MLTTYEKNSIAESTYENIFLPFNGKLRWFSFLFFMHKNWKAEKMRKRCENVNVGFLNGCKEKQICDWWYFTLLNAIVKLLTFGGHLKKCMYIK